MKNISSHLAWHYLSFKGKNKNISLMMKICFLGIAVGTFSLMLTLIITNGFEKTIHEKMQGINAQIIISSPGEKLHYQAITKVLQKEFGNHIAGIGGSTTKQALIDHKKNESIIFLKGIDPNNEHLVTNLAKKITWPPIEKTKNNKPFTHLLNGDKILIGYKTARSLDLKVGDNIKLMIPEPSSKRKIILTKKNITVAGIFRIGLEEYDNSLGFVSLDFLNTVFDEQGVENITIKLKTKEEMRLLALPTSKKKTIYKQAFFILKNIKSKIKALILSQSHEEKMITKLKSRLPSLRVQSWKELYPALVSSLKLEKYVMFFILTLITLVAAMNMISLLFMFIQQKRRDIAIYKTMGMPDRTIQKIFLRIGLFITLSASITGLGCAAVAGHLLEKYPFIKLPDVYYVSHLPAKLEPEIFIIVFLVTMFIGFIATWIPSKRTRKINVAQVLRQE